VIYRFNRNKVLHTQLWRLRNRGKCNRQRVYCGNVQRDVGVRLNRSCNIAKRSVWALDYIGHK